MTVRRTGRPRFEQIVEHDEPSGTWRAAARSVRPTEWRGHDASPQTNSRRAFGRRVFGSWLGVIGAVFAMALVAILAIQLTAVDASPGVNTAQFAGLEIRLVRAAVEPGRYGPEVVVVGEIANRSAGEIAVPAVRIALLSKGAERRTRHHAPGETRLVAGQTIRFQSTFAAPPADVDEVAFRLVERRGAVAGRR